jgi:DNA-binding XRE family transcriptional regulator
MAVSDDHEVVPKRLFAVMGLFDFREDVGRSPGGKRREEDTFLIAEAGHCVNLLDHANARVDHLMTRDRTRKSVRLSSNSPHSLVRTRTTRKSKSRKRPTPKRLAEKLALIRQRAGMSQAEIAKALGVENRASISGYERGDREPPLPVLLGYARLAKVSTDYLIDDEMDVPRILGPTMKWP